MSKSQQQPGRFAEVEYCLQSYFNSHVVPIMRSVKDEIGKKQVEELGTYSTSVPGIVRSFANGMAGMPDDTMQFLRLTGEWNSKTAEDYVEMCGERIASDTDITHDLILLADEWRKALVEEIGRERYDSLSEKLGADLALAYVDYRMEQMMINRMVADRMPRSSLEYIFQKGADNSLFGLSRSILKSPLEQDIEARAEAAYQPSQGEQLAGKAVAFGADTIATGGFSSWSTLLNLAGTEVVFTGIEHYLERKDAKAPTLTVEDCISRSVFGSERNVFSDFRKQSSTIVSYQNPYILEINKKLNQEMGILTEKPFWADWAEENERRKNDWLWTGHGPSADGTSDRYKDVPSIIAPGHEEEYLAMQTQEPKRERATEQTEISDKQEQELPEAENNITGQKSPEQTSPENHTNGWDGLFKTFGLDGIDNTGQNLGYVISMLPDFLFGLFNGKNQSVGIKDCLLPVASVLMGLFVKNPLLKLALIGIGGTNLLNKAGHEAIGRKETESPQLYKSYADEPLSPRLSNPVLQGNSLFLEIDRMPCCVRLPGTVVEAYTTGHLPLNTLANAVLAKHDATESAARENYRIAEEEQREYRERSVGIK